jgi:urease accessory protein
MAADTGADPDPGTDADADADADAEADPDPGAGVGSDDRADGPGRRPDPDPDLPHPAFAAYAADPVPAAAVGSPSKDGRLELVFETTSRGTALVRDFATAPFHVSGTLDADPHPDCATVYVQSPTGGLAQGDRLDATVSVGPDAVAHVTTGSATKVQTARCNYAGASTTLSVAAGGHVEYLPEPTILHAGARYGADLRLTVAADATAVVGDVVVPGRLARGERFAFDRYASRVEAVRAGDADADADADAADPLFVDATHLAPGEAPPTAPGVLGDFAVLGTTYVVAPDGDVDADALHAAAAGAGDGNDGDGSERDAVRAGATALPNDAGVAVRALGHRVEPVRTALRGAFDRARRDLLGVPAPPRRKC